MSKPERVPLEDLSDREIAEEYIEREFYKNIAGFLDTFKGVVITEETSSLIVEAAEEFRLSYQQKGTMDDKYTLETNDES